MNRIILTLLLGISYSLLNAQSDCEQGYEMKNVMCNGKLTSVCIPENYVCNSNCWLYDFALKSGSFENSIWGGGGQSYAECLQKVTEAQEMESHSKYPNTVYNVFNYRIYLNSSKFCNSRSAAEEMYLKINSLIDGWEGNVRDAIVACNGYEHLLPPLAITREWAENNQEAMRNITRLKEEVNRYSKMQLSFLERKFDEVTKDIEDFRIATSGYRNQANEEKNDEKLKQEKLKQEKLEKERLEREKRLKNIANENTIKDQLAKEKRKNDELLNNMKTSKASDNKEKPSTLLSIQAKENSIQNLLEAERQKKKEALSKKVVNQEQLQKFGNHFEPTENLPHESPTTQSNKENTQEVWTYFYTHSEIEMNYMSNVINLNDIGCTGNWPSNVDCGANWFYNKIKENYGKLMYVQKNLVFATKEDAIADKAKEINNYPSYLPRLIEVSY